MQVVFESRPDKPTKPADVARPNESPPPAALSFRSVPQDNDNSPPPAALTRPATPSLAIPPLPPSREVRCCEHVWVQPVPGRPADLQPYCRPAAVMRRTVQSTTYVASIHQHGQTVLLMMWCRPGVTKLCMCPAA